MKKKTKAICDTAEKACIVCTKCVLIAVLKISSVTLAIFGFRNYTNMDYPNLKCNDGAWFCSDCLAKLFSFNNVQSY